MALGYVFLLICWVWGDGSLLGHGVRPTGSPCPP
jgi:hypothetical protein